MIKIDSSWTLFLDRDGVLNERIVGGYVQDPNSYKWIDGVLPTLKKLRDIFRYFIVVTNQQGVGKKIMKMSELVKVHDKVLLDSLNNQSPIDLILFAPELATETCNRRKPKPDMGYEAREMFPEINFTKSIMIGDSMTDMEFGHNLGMKTVLVSGKHDDIFDFTKIDYQISSFAELISLIAY